MFEETCPSRAVPNSRIMGASVKVVGLLVCTVGIFPLIFFEEVLEASSSSTLVLLPSERPIGAFTGKFEFGYAAAGVKDPFP